MGVVYGIRYMVYGILTFLYLLCPMGVMYGMRCYGVWYGVYGMCRLTGVTDRASGQATEMYRGQVTPLRLSIYITPNLSYLP